MPILRRAAATVLSRAGPPSCPPAAIRRPLPQLRRSAGAAAVLLYGTPCRPARCASPRARPSRWRGSRRLPRRAARGAARRARRRRRDRRGAYGSQRDAAASSRRSRRAASRSTAASSRTSRRRASASRLPSRARRRTARRSTAPSTARARRPRPSPARRRCSRRCGPALGGSALASLLVGYAQPGGAAATQSGAGTFRVGASRGRRDRRRPDDARLRRLGARTGMRRARSSCATSRRAGSRCRSVRTIAGESRGAAVHGVARRVSRRAGRARTRHGDCARTAGAAGCARRRCDRRSRRRRARRCACRGRSRSRRRRRACSARVTLDRASFAPSDTQPAILTVQAGAVVADGGLQIEAVSRLDILLYTAIGPYVGGWRGCATCCPGAYSFGITGRAPTSSAPRRAATSCDSRPGRRCRAHAPRAARRSRSGSRRVDSPPWQRPSTRLTCARTRSGSRSSSSGRSPTRSASTTGSSTSSRSARRRSRSRSRRRWTTATCARSPATASRTTSRAARRRAASATTPTSRSTRSRRSRCG